MLLKKNLTNEQSEILNFLIAQDLLTPSEQKTVLANIEAIAVLSSRKPEESYKFSSDELQVLKLDEAQQKLLSELSEKDYKKSIENTFDVLAEKFAFIDAQATKDLFNSLSVKDNDILKVYQRSSPETKFLRHSLVLVEKLKHGFFVYSGCSSSGELVKNSRREFASKFAIDNELLKFEKFVPETE